MVKEAFSGYWVYLNNEEDVPHIYVTGKVDRKVIVTTNIGTNKVTTVKLTKETAAELIGSIMNAFQDLEDQHGSD